MEGIRTIRIEVSSDGDFFPVLKKSVVDYALVLGIPKAVCTCVEKEAESLFEEDLSKLSGPNLSLEISADEACVALLVWDNHHEPVAQRKIPVA